MIKNKLLFFSLLVSIPFLFQHCCRNPEPKDDGCRTKDFTYSYLNRVSKSYTDFEFTPSNTNTIKIGKDTICIDSLNCNFYRFKLDSIKNYSFEYTILGLDSLGDTTVLYSGIENGTYTQIEECKSYSCSSCSSCQTIAHTYIFRLISDDGIETTVEDFNGLTEYIKFKTSTGLFWIKSPFLK